MIILSTSGKRLLELDGPLAGADLRARDLRSACFDGLNLDRADLTEAILLGASFYDCSARDARLIHANLQGVHMEAACFDGADLTEADLYWVIALGASFRGARLIHASAQGADLKDVTFTGADLSRANLGTDNLGGYTSLQGADLTAADLSGTTLTGARYDVRTRFPQGFDPHKAGMVRADAAA